MTQSFKERFWDLICSAETQFQFLLIFTVTLLVLGLVALPLVERGTAAWVLLQLDLVIFGTVLALTLLVLRKCRSRRSDRSVGRTSDT